MRHSIVLLFALALCAFGANKPERLEWFRDLGFGLFIHWSLDSQVGSVISHSMVGASEEYLHWFVNDLPKTFNPRKFEPRDWAVLAKLAGMRYVVFTAKHHSGFCMFDTATTRFNIMNTPFRRDITREVLHAFAEQGIAPGLYFSPDDFHWLYRNGKRIDRNRQEVFPVHNPGLMDLDKAQIRELYTRYGPIDMVFFDGPPEGLRELAWELQPDTVVTRGAISTPEQYVPGTPVDEPWEACITMGTQWQYKPTNENYKSGSFLIGLLIETRAKGGNLLLNVGPKPDGELPIEQEERLREIALWMAVNGEAIYGVRPWVITNEGEIWFTRKKNADTVYAIVRADPPWRYGAWRDIVLRSVQSTAQTQVSVLGQNDQTLEYQPDVVPRTTWQQTAEGLKIRAMHAQRLYNDRKWPNPTVLKISHVRAALVAPRVETRQARWDASTQTAVLEGSLASLGDTASVEAGFEYRPVGVEDTNVREESWQRTPLQRRTAAGPFTSTVSGLPSGKAYEFRAVVRHPLLTLYGREGRLETR